MSKGSRYLTILFFLVLFTSPNNIIQADSSPIATLNYLSVEGTIGIIYGEMIASYLEPLGIELIMLNKSWEEYNQMLLFDDSWDLAYSVLNDNQMDADLSQYYSHLGAQNYFRLNNDTPEEYLNEDYLLQGISINDLSSRRDHYFEWQDFINELIVPIKPMFNPRKYEGTWSNLDYFDNRWGLSNCLPYMSFSSLHSGQTNSSEFNDAQYKWLSLQPLNQIDIASRYLSSLITEPMLVISPDLSALKTGLIEDWDVIDSYHMKYYIKNNVFWAPSYDFRLRNSSSIPLSTESFEIGINGEFSNGTNQQLTAKDAVFTLLAKAYDGVCNDSNRYAWIKDVYVDPVDNLSFHIVIDGDYTTPEQELFLPHMTALNIPILPEFFLNDTSSLELVQTLGGREFVGLYQGIHSNESWEFYENSAFGCGKLMIDYSNDNVTVLNSSPFWMGVGAIDGTTGLSLDIKRINIYHNLTDEIECLNAFESGDLDIFYNYQRFVPERISAQSNPNLDIQTRMSSEMSAIVFNIQRPFIGGLNNTKYTDEIFDVDFNYTRGAAIRKAICYAIDRDEINSLLHSSGYFKADSPMGPYFAFFYYNDIQKYDYDLTEAQRWLTIATTEYPIIQEFSKNIMVMIIVCSLIIPVMFNNRRKRRINNT